MPRTLQLLRLVSGLALGLVLGTSGACSEDYDCGERDLPGTLDCPCLPGKTCAADLVCKSGTCRPIPSDSMGDSTSSTGAETGSDTGTAGSDTSTSGSDTGTGG